MKTPVFDLAAYTRDQLIDAMTCPLNRHATRVEHGCNDFDLHKHPEWLMEHYIRCGGAKAFEKRRGEYVRTCEFIDSCRYAENCKLTLTVSGYSNCPLRQMSDVCRTKCDFVKCPRK